MDSGNDVGAKPPVVPSPSDTYTFEELELQTVGDGDDERPTKTADGRRAAVSGDVLPFRDASSSARAK